jgi:hypothetical protein
MFLQRSLLSGVIAIAACAVTFADPAQATPVFNANLTHGVYFGTGNPDGGWTVETVGGYELALRAKLYTGATATTPQPGTGIYDFKTGTYGLGKFPNRPLWNWEFSIDNLGGSGLSGVTATLSISDAAGLHNAPLNLLAIGDNNIGDNGNGRQNSESMVFGFLPGFNPWVGDGYGFSVSLNNNTTGALIATDSIVVNAVPEPVSMALLGAGLTFLGIIRRRRAA